MNYTDDYLQEHELGFWLNAYKLPFIHENFYKEFFNFENLNEKTVLEFGCGGCPISEYTNANFKKLILVDPLLKLLTTHTNFSNLNKHENYSISILDFNLNETIDVIIGLNVIDHFNDPDYKVIDKLHSLLPQDGELWLYYDVRPENSGNHLSIDNEKITKKIEEKFQIIKINEDINPTHINWSGIKKSVRLIAKKIK
jgi:2-polyprenyl-3-methyl-5-hydroxy-6-metoxy-1,4-benzoquinol methylase